VVAETQCHQEELVRDSSVARNRWYEQCSHSERQELHGIGLRPPFMTPSPDNGAFGGAVLLTHWPMAALAFAPPPPRAVVDNTCNVGALGFPVAATWFSTRQVADGITLITEPHVDALIRANFYHVRGSEADLIVNTGTGIAPLAWVLGGLMDPAKQVIAVATHTHYDHVGGMHECRRTRRLPMAGDLAARQ
jgi:hypothetical protein